MKTILSILCCMVLLTTTLPAEKIYTLEQLTGMLESNNLLMKISALDKKIAKEEYRMERALE
ncbi:MAG: hypothetical protein GY765_14840, partial [bacterium]|nr:hypothetical protein [bacterium]